MSRSILASLCGALLLAAACTAVTGASEPPPLAWRHLSTVTGDLPLPGPGTQQTASLVLDADRDGILDFVITERTKSPSVVWYRRTAAGWDRYVVDAAELAIEAGGAACDVDGDGDPDILFGGDWRSNEVWWWENPCPRFDRQTPWTRRLVKNSGGRKHHDQLVGDFDGDGREELVFWNQGAKSLCLAEIPADPKRTQPWPYSVIDTWKEGAEHEGLARADVDGDGTLDIIGGGNWYRHVEGTRYAVETIDAHMRFTRAAAGQLIEGGRPEVVFSPGDADGPLMLYQWDGTRWAGRDLLGEPVIHGHTLRLGDVDGDGHLDIFSAEMRLDGGNAQAKMRLLLGDGRGGFRLLVVATGLGNHESRLADLDGDGRLDILGKPYNWETPRLDVWINQPAAARR